MPTLPCPAALPTCPAAHLARWYTAFISFYCRTPARRYTAFIPLYPIGVAGEMNAVYDALPFVSDRRLRSVALPNALNFGFDYSLFLKVGAPAVASTILCSSRWVGLLLLGKACEPLRSLDEGAQAGGGGGGFSWRASCCWAESAAVPFTSFVLHHTCLLLHRAALPALHMAACSGCPWQARPSHDLQSPSRPLPAQLWRPPFTCGPPMLCCRG